MPRNKDWAENGANASGEFLDDLEEDIKHPNPEAQKAIENNGRQKKGPGRTPDPENIFVDIQISEIGRPEGFPTIITSGTCRRHDVQQVSLPVPIEIFDRIKDGSSNTTASFVGLIKYALDKLDEEKKSIHVKYTKKIN